MRHHLHMQIPAVLADSSSELFEGFGRSRKIKHGHCTHPSLSHKSCSCSLCLLRVLAEIVREPLLEVSAGAHLLEHFENFFAFTEVHGPISQELHWCLFRGCFHYRLYWSCARGHHLTESAAAACSRRLNRMHLLRASRPFHGTSVRSEESAREEPEEPLHLCCECLDARLLGMRAHRCEHAGESLRIDTQSSSLEGRFPSQAKQLRDSPALLESSPVAALQIG
mmetsp:Transcript_84230/g.146268  ORF Transcript_84230/g.146268 Transcript_84230/m.146268 type:complete len:224 (-) Transcript_84230:245-916(-)